MHASAPAHASSSWHYTPAPVPLSARARRSPRRVVLRDAAAAPAAAVATPRGAGGRSTGGRRPEARARPGARHRPGPLPEAGFGRARRRPQAGLGGGGRRLARRAAVGAPTINPTSRQLARALASRAAARSASAATRARTSRRFCSVGDGKALRGIEDGVRGMRQGGVRRLVLPLGAALAYAADRQVGGPAARRLRPAAAARARAREAGPVQLLHVRGRGGEGQVRRRRSVRNF